MFDKSFVLGRGPFSFPGKLKVFPLSVKAKDFLFVFLKNLFIWFFIILFIQYYSVICRPSDHTVGRPRAEIRTRAGRPKGRDTTPRPPHHLYFTSLDTVARSNLGLSANMRTKYFKIQKKSA